MMDHHVVIVGAARTPMGAFLGGLSQVSAPRLGAAAIAAALSRAKVNFKHVDEVIMGHVLQGGVGQAPARQACIYAGLPTSVRCTTINKVCGSGLKAVALARHALLLKEADIIVAGGMESMSQAPYAIPKAREGLRLGNGEIRDLMIYDGLWDPYNHFHMGQAAEMCVQKYAFSREVQDAYAIGSYRRAQDAIEKGYFAEEITPIEGSKGRMISVDEGPERLQEEKVPTLSPVFLKDGGTITAANASSINDGAAAVVLMRAETAQQLKLPVLATLGPETSFAQDPAWFTTAPVGAIQKLLAKSRLDVGDIDVWEINEAFAVVVLATMTELNLDAKKVNPCGGAIALGHPIGASGCRMLVTLVHTLRRAGHQRGIACLCIGGGEAIAMLVEIPASQKQ